MTLALANPVRGSEPLFEQSFDAVHLAIGNSSLPQRGFEMVARYLPDLWWWEQWDICLRLRIAVVRAYENGSLADESFRRLTSDRSLAKQLKDLRRNKRRSDFVE
jgi:hypothetical protein